MEIRSSEFHYEKIRFPTPAVGRYSPGSFDTCFWVSYFKDTLCLLLYRVLCIFLNVDYYVDSYLNKHRFNVPCELILATVFLSSKNLD